MRHVGALIVLVIGGCNGSIETASTSADDQSGSAQVLRVTRDGRVTSRAQVAGDIPITQLVAGRDVILALRADQKVDRIERYLGWADVGVRDASFVGDHVAVSTSTAHWLWLDDRLVARGSLAVGERAPDLAPAGAGSVCEDDA